jgi:energy-coupling factor transporter ATP-binding protein EcfA2
LLHGVDLSILPGEIHGLVGENGSGKSTLVKILGGVHTPDRGSAIWLHNQPVSLPVRNAQPHGLAIIHRDLGLIESMSVADNVGISTGFGRSLVASISARRENGVVRALAEKFGLSRSATVFSKAGPWAIPLLAVILYLVFSILAPHTFASLANLRAMIGSQATVLLLAMAALIENGPPCGWLVSLGRWPRSGRGRGL